MVTPQNIYEVHHRRNWWLMDAMRYMRYVLCENEGLKRVRRALIEMGLPEPEFEHKPVGNALVRVTLRNNRNVRAQWVDRDVSEIIDPELAKSLTDEKRRMINFAVEHGGRIKTTEAMKLMARPRWGTAQKMLKDLEKKGVLRFVSRYQHDPKAHYEIVHPQAGPPPRRRQTRPPMPPPEAMRSQHKRPRPPPPPSES
jgi:predicted HTH transcriptional regulator